MFCLRLSGTQERFATGLRRKDEEKELLIKRAGLWLYEHA